MNNVTEPEVEWEDPPPDKPKKYGYHYCSAAEMIAMLKEHPGQWAVWKRSAIARQGSAHFLNKGCEVRWVDTGERGPAWTLYIRWPE